MLTSMKHNIFQCALTLLADRVNKSEDNIHGVHDCPKYTNREETCTSFYLK